MPNVTHIIKSIKEEFVAEVSKILEKSNIGGKDQNSNSEDKDEQLSLAIIFQRAENIETLKPHQTENNVSIDAHKNLIVCDVCVDDSYSNLGGFHTM